MRDSASMLTRPRVLLADDHAIVAEALRLLLADRCQVIGVVGDGRSLISKARELKPDLIVADIGMPALNGLDAAEQLKYSMPNVRFVFLTMMQDPELATAALRMAPVGFVLKHSAADELLKWQEKRRQLEHQKVRVHQLYRKAEGIDEHLQSVAVPAIRSIEPWTRIESGKPAGSGDTSTAGDQS